MRRVQAEAVGHADGFFVEPFQFGVRHVLNLGGLVQQFAIEQFPAQRFGQFPGDLAAPGAYSRVMVMTFMQRAPRRDKNRPRQKILLVGPGCLSALPLPEADPQGRSH